MKNGQCILTLFLILIFLTTLVSANTLTIGKTTGSYKTSDYPTDVACFQAAFKAANSGDTVSVLNGTYSITSTLTCVNKNLNFVGNGATILNLNVPAGEDSGMGGIYFAGSKVSTGTSLTTNLGIGSSVITLPSVTWVKQGDLILIWNSDVWAPLITDDAGNYPDQLTGEMYQIVAVNNTAKTVTLNEPLLRAYPTSKSSKYNIYRPSEYHIDNLIINGPSSSGDYLGIGLEYTTNSTVTRCSVIDNGYNNIAIWRSWNTTVSNCFIENALRDGCGYGVACWSGSAYSSVVNNTIKWCRHCITANSDERNSLTRNLYYSNNMIWGGGIAGANCIDAHVDCISQDVENNIIHTNNTAWLFAFDDGAQNTKFINNTVYGGNGGMIDKRGLLEGCTYIYKNNTAIGVNGYIYQGGDASDPTNVCHDVLFDYENNTQNSGDVGLWMGNSASTGLSDSFRDIIVKNNLFSSIRKNAVYIYTSIDNANFTINNNKFTSIQGDGIYLNGNNHIGGKITTSGNTMTNVNLGGSGSNTGIETVDFSSVQPSPTPAPTPDPTPMPPITSFTASPTSGKYPLKVSFVDTSTNETSRQWDFGDGYTSTSNPVTHTYSQRGSYTAKLAAMNSVGSVSATKTITVRRR